MSDISRTLLEIHLPDGRGNVLRGISESLIIDGTYNGGFDPIVAGVHMAQRLAQKDDKKLIAILGDMRELGSEETARHRELWNTLRQCVDVQYIFVGKVSQTVIAPMLSQAEGKHVSFFLDAREAGKYAHHSLLSSDKKSLVFAKGSQNTIYLEEAIREIVLPEELIKLVRQDTMYMEKKQAFWKTIVR